MRKILAVICVLAVASLTAPAAAAASACNDDIDNDGDGAKDEGDSGCSPPYRLDDSEQKVWDTDATSKFDGSSIFGAPKDSVSLMMPGKLRDGEGGTLQDSGSPLQEGFVVSPGDGATGKYGQGSFSSTSSSSIPGSWETRNTGFLGLFGSKEYVDPPRNGDCGDGNDDGESPLECPTDVGMADDMGDSEETVSDVTGKYEIDDDNRIEMHENSGSHSYDMTESNNGQNYGLDKDTGGSDYYINPDDSDKLMELDKSPTETTRLGEVESVTGLDSETAHTTSSTSEITGTSCSGENCTSTLKFYCSGVTSETVYDHKLEETTETLTESVTDVHTESDGEGFSVVSEGGGELEVDVTKNVVKDDGTLTDYETTGCGSAVTTHSCDGTGCDISGSVEDHSVGGATNYNPDEPSTEQETLTYTEIKYPDSKSDWPREKFLDLDESQTKEGTAMTQVVASEDYDEEEVYHKEGPEKGYFSVDHERDDIEFGNNRDFGWSTFDLTMNGNKFATTLTDHKAYEADGDDGGGDTLVAVHTGEGIDEIVGSSSNFGPHLSSSDIQVDCPDPYTKCVAAVDVSLDSFDTWNSHDNPEPGAEYSVVAKAGLGEGLSACKMYQNLNSGGEEVQCTYENGTSPLPYGPYTDEPDEFKGVFAGPEADTSRNTENPVFAEHQISQNQCVFNGTTYNEGRLKDIGAEVTLASGDGNVIEGNLEAGGHNLDQEVCLNMDGDNRGEWHDLDKTSVNEHVIETEEPFEASPSKSVESLVTENPDSGADPSTGVAGQGSSLEGMSLEDDCHSSLDCGDNEGDNNEGPYFVPFYEGAVTADYNPFASGGDVDGDGEMERQVDLREWRNNHPVPASVSSITGEVGPPSDAGNPPDGVEGGMPRGVQSAQEAEGVHNTVDTSGGDEHGSGTDQSQETDSDMSFGPLENSRIDSEDDEWGISPDLSYVIDNFGRSYATGECYGEGRDQGDDLDKKQRIYANSYANDSSGGGEWLDPDATVRTINRGGITCDLTGRDWGIAYDTLVASELLPEAGGRMPEDKGLTFIGKGKLIPPKTEGSGGGTLPEADTGGVPSSDLCIGGGCEITEGSPTDRDPDDTFVDEQGDNMSGTLVTPKLQAQNDLCVGSRCKVDRHIESDGLGADNTKGDQLDLVVPNITAASGDLCVGSTSEC